MLLYYITDRKQFAGTERDQRLALLRRVSGAASAGVDYIQLREKDLTTAELERFASEVVRAVREQSEKTKLLINSRTDVAIAAGADGVHLTSTDIPASEARAIWIASAASKQFHVAVSCHSVADVHAAEAHGADFVVLGPVFEKADTAPIGLKILSSATRGRRFDRRVEAGDNRGSAPVLALGGVNLSNARACLEAGAAGVAGIRLFQESNISECIRLLREAAADFVTRSR